MELLLLTGSSLTLALIGFVIFLIISYHYLTRPTVHPQYPPGPIAFPLLGNLPQIALCGSMSKFCEKYRKIYGNVSSCWPMCICLSKKTLSSQAIICLLYKWDFIIACITTALDCAEWFDRWQFFSLSIATVLPVLIFGIHVYRERIFVCIFRKPLDKSRVVWLQLWTPNFLTCMLSTLLSSLDNSHSLFMSLFKMPLKQTTLYNCDSNLYELFLC